jgi:signal transduction histidine kinase
MLDTILLIIVVIINVILITVVLFRDVKSKINRLYVLVAGTLIVWSIANYFTNHVSTYGAQLFTNRLAFAAGFLIAASVWLFSSNFPRKLIDVKYQNTFAVIMLPTVLVLCFTPLIIARTSYRVQDEVTDIIAGSLYPIYLIGVGGFFGLVAYNFYRSSRNADRVTRAQIFYISAGILSTFLWIAGTSAIVPAVTGDWEISKYGGIGSVLLISLTAYAIIKHGLFDIRFFIARAIAYTMLLGTATLIFAVLVVTLPASVIGFDSPNIARQAYYTVSAVGLAFVFQPLKRVFDRFTNSIFYRDAYEPQEFISELNKLLVSSIELEYLLNKSATIIQENLKSDYCLFALKETETEDQRIIGTVDKRFSKEDVDFARHITTHILGKVIVTDYLDSSNELHARLQKNKIAVLVRLVERVEDGNEGIGYIVLGPKKSGNPYNSQDIRMLEIVANELVIAIQNALRFEEIQKFNITLQEEVERATHRLQKTNEKLKALDETKDDFISMASHQLRTPLTSVKGYLSMVIEGDAGKVSAKQEKLLNQAFISSQRMVYLIADLLNVSRLRTGKFVIEPTTTNLADVIEGEVQQLVEVAQGRDLKLTYTKPKDFPTLLMDETKIRQVLMNFIDNAIYYTPAGGHIDVKLEETADSITLKVVDDGIGVPKHEQHHLFTKFFRAGNAKKARPDGTGLGLFMAKKVIIAQGGSIVFRSHEGKGSTFGFTFAKAKLRPPKNTPIRTTEAVGESL